MKATHKVELSVVIVNYNTREELRSCLTSIFHSRQNIRFEVWIVDNNSTDMSSRMVERKFPETKLIKNAVNLGFARANNQAISQSQSNFVLLLNPDTIVSDHAFDEPIAFLSKTPEVGMVSCKLIKRDGSLDLACRRSFPSAFDAFCRAVGLSKILPKSPFFARYNLTFLDENRISEVDAINGAFMMVKRAAIEDVGLLDEDYFMYMEDMDWCFRFKKKGWKIYYLPSPTVVHLKGQSGKKASYKMIREFFKSMEIFCSKNYFAQEFNTRFWFTLLGIRVWMIVTLFRNSIRLEKRVTP